MNETTNDDAKSNNNNGGGKKVIESYEKNLKKLVAIVGGEKNLKSKSKIGKDKLADLVSELFKEETLETEKNTKEALKQLLKNRVEMSRLIDAKKKELVQLEETKMKEFNEAAVKLFNQVEGIDTLEKEYYAALTDATTAEAKLDENNK